MYYLPYMEIKFAVTDAELLLCRDAILELRPHISADEYLAKAKLLLAEGAKMIYVAEGDVVPAVSVFRMNYYFYRGKNIYIDDLSTQAKARGKGYAGKLLDFDLASNVGGWQWAAGCGVDAAPYFRIFNPYLQTQKFDPKLEYVRKWVPEFEGFNYVQPIVQHEFARKRCLEVYAKTLKKD